MISGAAYCAAMHERGEAPPSVLDPCDVPLSARSSQWVLCVVKIAILQKSQGRQASDQVDQRSLEKSGLRRNVLESKTQTREVGKAVAPLRDCMQSPVGNGRVRTAAGNETRKRLGN